MNDLSCVQESKKKKCENDLKNKTMQMYKGGGFWSDIKGGRTIGLHNSCSRHCHIPHSLVFPYKIKKKEKCWEILRVKKNNKMW